MSAALGDQLDAVLYGEGVDTEMLLNFLETDESGRAMLIPLSVSNASDKLKSFKNPGVLGLASNLVKVNQVAQGLATFLLGRVLIVKNRSTAKQIGAGNSGRSEDRHIEG